MAERALKKSARRKNDKAAAEVRDHARARAEALVRAGMRIWGLDEEALRALPRGERRKALIALVVKAETAAPLDWVAARSTVSREIGALAKVLPKEPKLKRLRDKIVAADEWRYWNLAI